jgi:hypothetical protein
MILLYDVRCYLGRHQSKMAHLLHLEQYSFEFVIGNFRMPQKILQIAGMKDAFSNEKLM